MAPSRPTRPRLAAGGDGGLSAPPVSVGWLAVAGLLVTSLLVSLSAAHSELVVPTSLRPLPGSLAGPLEDLGFQLGLTALIATFLVMFVSYAVAARTAHRLPARVVIASIVALHGIVLLGPPLFSSDVFSYAAYAKIGFLYSANPYLHGPASFPLTELNPLIGSQWLATPTVYGPVFTVLSYLLTPLGLAANVFAYKAVAALSSLTLIALTWRAARLRGMNAVKAVALVGLNPVIIVFGVGGGHNDLLMLAILLAAVCVLLQARERSGGALLVVATAVKLTAGLVFPFALAARRDPDRKAPRAGLLAGGAIAAIAVLGLGYAFFGTGPLHVAATLQGIQAEGGEHSIAGFLLGIVGAPGLVGPLGLALTVAFAAIVAWLLRRVWIGELDWIAGAGWATVALICTTGFLVPWYVSWLIPLAALSRDRRLLVAAVLLTGVGLTTL